MNEGLGELKCRRHFVLQMAGMDVQTDPGIPSGQGWKPPNLMHLGMEPEMY